MKTKRLLIIRKLNNNFTASRNATKYTQNLLLFINFPLCFVSHHQPAKSDKFTSYSPSISQAVKHTTSTIKI